MTRVCPLCFGETVLKKIIERKRPEFPNRKCTFHPRYKGVPVEDVATIIDPVFRNHFGWRGDTPDGREQQGGPLKAAVGELVRAVDDGIADAIARQLIEDDDYEHSDDEQRFYRQDQTYARYEPGDFRYSDLWRNFCESVVHGQRFFNTDARDLIAELFNEIHRARGRYRQAPVYVIRPGEPGSKFYRARIVNHDNQRKEIISAPGDQLGPPPKRLRRAGRMNPAGIACFYGAFNVQTCISELRPDVGSTVVSARFALIRPIHVLDTTQFVAPMRSMSLFSSKYMARFQQWKFMQNFMNEAAKPILPGDEHLDYIPTQAVAEYLLYHYAFVRRDQPEKIEGIIYPSAQAPKGKNIVLLGEAAQVEAPPREKSRKPRKTEFGDRFPKSIASFMGEPSDRPNPGLRIVAGSTRTRRVKGARYHSAAV